MKWEYLTWAMDSGVDITAELDKLGSHGWELVQVVEWNNSFRCFFKRQK